MGLSIPNDPVDRNTRGMALEKSGAEDEAVACYEANVRDRFDGTFPYERLAIIFRRRRDYAREIEVIEAALAVFEPKGSYGDFVAKLQGRLTKARGLAVGDPVSPVRKPSRPPQFDASGRRICTTKGCGRLLSGNAKLYCDECRDVRAAPNAFREGDLRPEKLFFGVAGTQHHLAAARSVREGDRLYLVRDPANPHDPLAIEVRGADGRLVGYVPRSGELQGKWGSGPYTQADLARALDAGANYFVNCYAAGGTRDGSVQLEGHCNGWMVPHPARLEAWAERGSSMNAPPDPLPFTVRWHVDGGEAPARGHGPSEDAGEPLAPKARPQPTSWWRRLFGG
jgi:hypothetical protein